ncbi:MAG: serine hydrolase [Saprospiraceae bacterium]|nr:serine hydrolase [Saprospiraceae bacterium]
MFRKIGYLIAVLLTVGWQLSGQSVTEDYAQALSRLILLQDDADLIPLQRLDTLDIALLNIGLLPGNDFEETLRDYTRIQTLPLPEGGSAKDAAEWASRQQAFDLFIIGINDYESAKLPEYLIDQFYIAEILARYPAITVVFGGARALDQLYWLEESEGIVLTPQNDYAGSLAAQLLMGGVGTEARTARDYGAAFPAGSGMDRQGGLRLGFVPPAVAGFDVPLLTDSIRHILEEGIQHRAFPGGQILIAHRGKVVVHEAFGYQTYDSLRQVTTDDLYDLASVTKITSALPALMHLHGRDSFELDAPLVRYFPSFKGSNKAKLTYRAMLAHQAGLMPWIPYWKGTLRGHGRYPWKKRWDPARINDGRYRWWTFKQDSSRRYPTRIADDIWLHRNYKKRIFKAIRKSPVEEHPDYAYSGLLFYLLPDIVENITGEPYEAYLKKTFYHPLGAYATTYNPTRYFPLQRIVPTERDTFFSMQLIHGRVHDEGAAMMAGISANAGLFSTALDLAKIMQMYLNGGTYGGRRYIAEASVKEFTRCQYCEADNRRGLGFDKPMIEYDFDRSYIAESAGPESFGHSGFVGHFTWADPESGLLVVLLTNRVHPTRANRGLYELAIRPRLHQAIYDAMEDLY